jgi:hypothetical protein
MSSTPRPIALTSDQLDIVMAACAPLGQRPLCQWKFQTDPVTSNTTNSGRTRHRNGTPLVPMPLVT